MSNWHFSPFSIGTTDVKEGHVLRPSQDYEFQDYISHVKRFDYHLTGIKEAIPDIELITTSSRYIVRDNSRNYLAVAFESSRPESSPHYTGTAIFIPPPTDITVDDSIDLLLQKFGRCAGREPPLAWVFQIPVTGLNEINQALEDLDAEKESIEQKINSKNKKNKSLLIITDFFTQEGLSWSKQFLKHSKHWVLMM